MSEKNIFILPQERAISYINKIKSIDILIIDEFYKASKKYDKDRASALLKVIIKLGQKAKQRYFLAPNIKSLAPTIFTQGLEFEKIDFNTVSLERFDEYKKIIGSKEEKERRKEEVLLRILDESNTKSLIYAASYPQIDKLVNLLGEHIAKNYNELLENFSNWLSVNYSPNWKLCKLVKNATGIHNGRLHRSISQIQIKLFEEENGLNNIISTSSIIEGVNTSAENVIIWKSKKGKGNQNLDNFTYKNIIGRGGRMFKYFVGKNIFA